MPTTLEPYVIEILEQSTGVYTATLKDETGVAVALASINSISMTLVNLADSSTVNSRSNQNVLNANNCTMHATSGLFTWVIQPADTTLVDTTLETGYFEEHLATITVVYGSTKKVNREILLKIRAMRSVPQS